MRLCERKIKTKLVFTDDCDPEELLIKAESVFEAEEEILGDDYLKDVVIVRTESIYEDVTKLNKKPLKKKLIMVMPEISKNTIVLKRTSEFDLHVQNLQTIMRCSNATPFRTNGKDYTCCFCPEKYHDTTDLKIHTTEKHPSSNRALVGRNLSELLIRLDITDLQCKLCNTKIDTPETLMKHLKEEHSQRLHTCRKTYIIPFRFDTGQDFRCTICALEFNNFKMLFQHMHNHYPNFMCDTCGSGFVNQRTYQSHVNRHANGEHKCEKCQRIFNNENKLKDHEKAVHRGFNKRNKCNYCQERFIGYVAKNAHMIKVHGMAPIQVKCPACDKTFKQHKYLARHKRTFHLMEKKHKCSECEKMFFSLTEIKQHMLTHTGQRDFQCAVCSKSYGRKSTLREHMRIHADDRRFKCEHCGAAFVQKCSWRGHMRSKHGEEV